MSLDKMIEKKMTTRFKLITTSFALVVLFGGAAIALSLTTGQVPVYASSEKKGPLHVTKECSQYTGAPGSYCTVTFSNISAIKVGTRISYDQALGIPEGLLDSNVVLDAGQGDRAVGRCTLDTSTGNGLCTFSDGMGRFTGFQARVNVTYTGGPNYRWDGAYSFSQEDNRERDR